MKDEESSETKNNIKEEAKEHPSFSKKQIKQIVKDHSYKHEKGSGGRGGSPVKFVKREETLGGRQAMHDCGHLSKGPQSNYD